MDLPKPIRDIVAETARNWPKKLDSFTLLRELDALAKKVYAAAKECS